VRTRLIIGTVVLVVVLVPQMAWAICMEQPFDRVVRSVDAVLVGTVADAQPRGNHQSGVIVRLNVEQVLRGSAEDGQRVWISSCGPVIVGPMAKSAARAMIGTRELFLLSRTGDGTFSQYSDITTPQGMTLDEKIARARQVLGLPTSTWTDVANEGPMVPVVVLLFLATAALVAGIVFVVGRVRRR